MKLQWIIMKDILKASWLRVGDCESLFMSISRMHVNN